MDLKKPLSHELADDPVDAPLPEDESVLWEGRPDPGLLVRRALHLPVILGWFGLLALWRLTGAVQAVDAVPVMADLAWLSALALVVWGMARLYARALARNTLYQITERRVVLRFGLAFPGVLNIPHGEIRQAFWRARKDGSGDIALDIGGGTGLNWLVLWPHVRPWRLKEPQPALRALPDVDGVAEVLRDAAVSLIEATPEEERRAPSAAAGPEYEIRPGERPVQVPVPALVIAGLFIVTAGIMAAVAQSTGAGATDFALPAGPPAAERTVVFQEDASGLVRIVDQADGALVRELQPGEGGFLRGVLRPLDRERMRHGVQEDAPYRLARWDDGSIILEDPGTGLALDVVAFGRTSVSIFAELLP